MCVHNSKVLRMCLAYGNIFENVGFPKEMRQNHIYIYSFMSNPMALTEF